MGYLKLQHWCTSEPGFLITRSGLIVLEQDINIESMTKKINKSRKYYINSKFTTTFLRNIKDKVTLQMYLTYIIEEFEIKYPDLKLKLNANL